MARHIARVVESWDAPLGGPALTPRRTVLVVARDSAAGGEIVGALQRRGFPAAQAQTGPQALYWARREPPALSILDAQVREWKSLGAELREVERRVIVLTDDADARGEALSLGCLDAPLKGADPRDLARRVEILIGRARPSEGGGVVAGPLVVDLHAKRLSWHGREIPAPRLLLGLAAYLAARPGEAVSPEVLLEEVWGEPWADPNKVHQAMWRLRRLLGEPADSPFLIAKKGHGYAIIPDGATSLRPRRLSGA